MKIYNELIKIARSLAIATDEEDSSVIVLCQRINYFPRYITIKVNNDQWKLIKIKNIKIINKPRYYEEFVCSIINMNKNYSRQLKNNFFQWQKIVNAKQLKQQLLFGQFNLAAIKFQQIYNIAIDRFKYKDLFVYILNDKFKQQQIENFIDQVYRVVPHNIIKKYCNNVQFKLKLQNNHIAQNNGNSIQITEYNVHAFVHQIGHSIFDDIKFDKDKIQMIFRVQDKQHFPTQRSRKNIEQLFAELFALYFLNKNQLTIQQIDLIDYIVFNKRILRARIKIYDCSNEDHSDYLEQLFKNHRLNKRLFVFKKSFFNN